MINTLRAWLALSRAPFHTVGILPFVLGNVLAFRQQGNLRWAVMGWGIAGVVLTMLATYYAGEYWDYREDTLSGSLGPSRFSGGSQVIQRGLVPRRALLLASIIALLLALVVAAGLQAFYHTGPWTLALAAAGLLGGFFYSTRPVRWVSTGIGELWIAFCYGWLPVAAGYYLQVGDVVPLIHWIAAPIGLSILNVILLNEFPDYPADREVGKRNLAVRVGLERAAWLYAISSVASWITTWLAVRQGVPRRVLVLYLPVLVLSCFLVFQVIVGRWRHRAALERLCGMNIAVNLGTTAAFILAYVW